MALTIVAYGELLWDVFPEHATLGGAPLNFAYRVTSPDATGCIISRVGLDERGDDAVRQVKSLGLDTSYIQRDTLKPTGTVSVELDTEGSPEYTIHSDVAYDFIRPAANAKALVKTCDCLCFGTLAQRTSASRHTLELLIRHAEHAVLFCDLNLRKNCYTAETVEHSLATADFLKLNHDELDEIASMFAIGTKDISERCDEIIRRWKVDGLVVTHGKYGAYAHDRLGERVYVPGYRVDVADTVGAGDAFTAGFVRPLLRGAPLRRACDEGARLGALASTKAGGTAPITGNELQELVDHPGDRHLLQELDPYR